MEQKTEPLVSIGLPVYNGEPYLIEAIQSILDQTYRNLELIICDNDFSDNTAEICESSLRATLGSGTFATRETWAPLQTSISPSSEPPALISNGPRPMTGSRRNSWP